MSEKKSVGFPDLTQHAEYEPTRPMPLHELPLPTRIDTEMAIVRANNPRIAKSIEVFWGHRDCVEYLEQLILSGGDGFGNARVGFKREVLSALMNLATLHEVKER